MSGSCWSIALACALAMAATDARAIVTRHDIDGVATREEVRRVAAVGKVRPDGEAVLIAPRWALTAAHVATGAPRERLRVQFAGIEYRVAEVFPYRDWEPGTSDIALMRLARPVQFVTPLELHEDELSEGAVVVLAGRGDFGDGQRGVVANDGQLRIVQNAIWKLESRRLSLRLDAPDAGALAQEGISGPGDSGTPALVEHNDRFEIVGIGSVGSSPDGARYGIYGSVDVFIRTAHYRQWILGVMEP